MSRKKYPEEFNIEAVKQVAIRNTNPRMYRTNVRPQRSQTKSHLQDSLMRYGCPGSPRK